MIKFAGIIALTISFIFGSIGINTEAEAKGMTTTQKKQQLISMGYPKDVVESLFIHCKTQAKNPNHCVKVWAMILGAESTFGTNCTKSFNCFGMEDGRTKYKSKDEGIKDWVRRYCLYWYKQTSPNGFYSDTVKRKPVTRYCMGGKAGFCKDWHTNAWKVWNKLSNF